MCPQCQVESAVFSSKQERNSKNWWRMQIWET
jgi:hypothetical protein